MMATDVSHILSGRNTKETCLPKSQKLQQKSCISLVLYVFCIFFFFLLFSITVAITLGPFTKRETSQGTVSQM